MKQDLHIETIEKLLRNCHQALRRRFRTAMAAGGFSALLAVLVVFVLLEQVLFLSPVVKSVFWIAAIGGSLVAVWLIRQRITIPPFTAFYRSAADEIGLPGIRHILDLSHSRYPVDSGLTDAAVRQNLTQIASENPEGRLQRYRDRHPASTMRKYSIFTSIAGIFLLAGVLLWAGDAFYRSSTFWVSYQRPIPFEFSVSPGDTTIEQGSSFQVAVRFAGSVPDQVRLGLRSQQENEPRIQGMVRHDEQTFLSRETELFEDAEFFVDMDGFRTGLHHVRVELLPRLQELTVTAHPPGYTGLDSETFTYPFNRMDAVAGSELEIRARKNKPLQELHMIAENSGDTLSFSPDSLITERITALSDERYHFVMRDEFGLENSNPFRFRLSVTADQPPFVEILSPESRINDFVTGSLPLLYEYEDDFGFTAVRLKYRLHKAFVNVPVEGSADLPVPGRLRGLAEYDWDVSRMNLGAMDRLEYWIEITDNNEFDGYQTTRSSTHIIEIPSLASRFFDQDEQEEQIESRFSEVEESYRRMQQDLERLREEIRTRPDE